MTLQNKLGLEYESTLTKQEIINKLITAYAQRKKQNLMAEDLSIEYRTRLTIVKKEAGEMKSATCLHNPNRIEE